MSPTSRVQALAAAVVAACGVLLPSAPARAQPDDAKARARTRVAEGARAYEQGDYDGALTKFKAAYAQFPSPKLLFNIGLAYRGLARDAEALDAFTRFLAEVPDADATLKEEARGFIRELGDRVATVTVTCDVDGAEVTVDGRSYGVTPLARPIVVAAGTHQIVVRRDGMPVPHIESIEPRRGVSLAVTASLFRLNRGAQAASASQPGPAGTARAPGRGPEPPAEPEGGAGGARRTIGWVLVGGGAIGLAAAVVEGIQARDKSERVASGKAVDDMQRFDPAVERDGKSAERLSIAAAIAGVALGGAGAALILTAIVRAPQAGTATGTATGPNRGSIRGAPIVGAGVLGATVTLPF